MRGTLTLQEFYSKNPEMNRYDSESLSATTQLNNDLNGLGIASSIEINVEIYDDGSYKYYSSWIRLDHPYLALYIRWDDRSKRYLIYEDFVKLMRHVDSYNVRDVRETLTEPAKIGVMTPKKIKDWVKYYEDLYTQLKVINDCQALREQLFRETLEKVDVKWNKGGNSGNIVKNGIEYSFAIQPTCISQQLELHYRVDHSLDNFLKLSDNKY